MKHIATVFALVLGIQQAFANRIDKLHTTEEVLDFLTEHVNKDWQGYAIPQENPNDTSEFRKGRFFKVDLDRNGLTDLVINGEYLVAITDDGNDKFSSHFIDGGAFFSDRHQLRNILYHHNPPVLLVESIDLDYQSYKEIINIDTIVFKFGNFIEFNPIPEDKEVNLIKISTSGCYGTCPVFELAIQADRSVSYTAIEYNNKTGEFASKITRRQYNKLMNTINYIKFSTLKDEYQVNWTDDETITLEVTFKNGTVKKIEDYGGVGTFGLRNLYAQLYKIRAILDKK